MSVRDDDFTARVILYNAQHHTLAQLQIAQRRRLVNVCGVTAAEPEDHQYTHTALSAGYGTVYTCPMAVLGKLLCKSN